MVVETISFDDDDYYYDHDKRISYLFLLYLLLLFELIDHILIQN